MHIALPVKQHHKDEKQNLEIYVEIVNTLNSTNHSEFYFVMIKKTQYDFKYIFLIKKNHCCHVTDTSQYVNIGQTIHNFTLF